jgi:sulfate adenylyltransferase subunit 1 (EFTu-like GTPase family)
MVIGASTAGSHILLTSAKLSEQNQPSIFFINNLLRAKDAVVAINKWILVGFSRRTLQRN